MRFLKDVHELFRAELSVTQHNVLKFAIYIRVRDYVNRQLMRISFVGPCGARIEKFHRTVIILRVKSGAFGRRRVESTVGKHQVPLLVT